MGKIRVKDEPLSDDDEFGQVLPNNGLRKRGEEETEEGTGTPSSFVDVAREKSLTGKRSRDEVDSGWGEGAVGEEEDEESLGTGGKKARFDGLGGVGSPTVAVGAELAEEAEEDEEGEDEFEEEEDDDEGDGDPNPMIAVGDKLIPFLEVGEDLQAAMVGPIFFLFPATF